MDDVHAERDSEERRKKCDWEGGSEEELLNGAWLSGSAVSDSTAQRFVKLEDRRGPIREQEATR